MGLVIAKHYLCLPFCNRYAVFPHYRSASCTFVDLLFFAFFSPFVSSVCSWILAHVLVYCLHGNQLCLSLGLLNSVVEFCLRNCLMEVPCNTSCDMVYCCVTRNLSCLCNNVCYNILVLMLLFVFASCQQLNCNWQLKLCTITWNESWSNRNQGILFSHWSSL